MIINIINKGPVRESTRAREIHSSILIFVSPLVITNSFFYKMTIENKEAWISGYTFVLKYQDRTFCQFNSGSRWELIDIPRVEASPDQAWVKPQEDTSSQLSANYNETWISMNWSWREIRLWEMFINTKTKDSGLIYLPGWKFLPREWTLLMTEWCLPRTE